MRRSVTFVRLILAGCLVLAVLGVGTFAALHRATSTQLSSGLVPSEHLPDAGGGWETNQATSPLAVRNGAEGIPPVRLPSPSEYDITVDWSKYTGDPGEVSRRDRIRPIYDPVFLSAQEADLKDWELVIGLSINGESKAYPVGILNSREIVNDVVGEVPVLVTWCPLCATGLVHGRRIDDGVHTFGNQGALYMNAMTWWDHETGSVWSQPIGAALGGTLAGTRLDMIPAGVLPWSTWKEEHPDTVALVLPRLQEIRASGLIADEDNFRREKFIPNLVIGVSLGKDAKAYPFVIAAQKTVINDQIGDVPVVVYANEENKAVHVFARKAGGRTLSFVWTEGLLTDQETGSVWDPATGFARAADSNDAALSPVISSSAGFA